MADGGGLAKRVKEANAEADVEEGVEDDSEAGAGDGDPDDGAADDGVAGGPDAEPATLDPAVARERAAKRSVLDNFLGSSKSVPELRAEGGGGSDDSLNASAPESVPSSREASSETAIGPSGVTSPAAGGKPASSDVAGSVVKPVPSKPTPVDASVLYGVGPSPRPAAQPDRSSRGNPDGQPVHPSKEPSPPKGAGVSTAGAPDPAGTAPGGVRPDGSAGAPGSVRSGTPESPAGDSARPAGDSSVADSPAPDGVSPEGGPARSAEGDAGSVTTPAKVAPAEADAAASDGAGVSSRSAGVADAPASSGESSGTPEAQSSPEGQASGDASTSPPDVPRDAMHQVLKNLDVDLLDLGNSGEDLPLDQETPADIPVSEPPADAAAGGEDSSGALAAPPDTDAAAAVREAEQNVAVRRKAGRRRYGLQHVLGYTHSLDSFDSDLEIDLLENLKRMGVRTDDFKLDQAALFDRDERDAAIAQMQAKFVSVLESFEALVQASSVRVNQRQNQAKRVATTLLSLVAGLHLVYGRMKDDLQTLHTDQSGWLATFEKSVISISVAQSDVLDAQSQRLVKDIDAVRSSVSDTVRLTSDVQHRIRDLGRRADALVQQYQGLTDAAGRRLVLSSVAGAMGGAAFGSLVGILLHLWSIS